MTFRTLRAAAVLLGWLAAFPTLPVAQQSGEIAGRVTDASGAVVPGVTVTLAGGALLGPQTATTSATGTYRFPQLAVGSYTVTFTLDGFTTVVREGIRIELNFNAQVNATMEVSSVKEVVTVKAETPIVDLRDTSRTNRFTQESLQSIPSARDPWVIIEQSAGIAMDRQNVGGSASGQQSNFTARGAAMGEQKWNLDGVDITDMAATGGSSMYFDFDAFEEMQITAGGADVSMQTPGVAVNLVTKSGTNKLRGSGRYYWTGDRFQSQNVTDEIRRQGVSTGNPLQRILDYGFEAGGPIRKERAWFWGSYGKQDIDVGVNGFYQATAECQAMKADPLSHSLTDIRRCLNSDKTLLNNYNAKLGLQLFRNNQFSFFFNGAEKVRNARGASDTHPIETTWRQGGVSPDSGLGSRWWRTGMPKTYKWDDRHVFSDRLLVEAQLTHVGNNFVLDFHEPGLYDTQPVYDYGDYYYRSYLGIYNVRPSDSLDVTGSFFAPGRLGGDHSFKFGAKYRNDEAIDKRHYGGNTQAVTFGGTASAWGTPTEAWLVRDSLTDEVRYYRSFFLQDSYNRKKMTLNLGFRWDYQTDEQLPSKVGAHPFYGQQTAIFATDAHGSLLTDAGGRYIYEGPGGLFDQLPAIEFQGAAAGFAFKNFSPRLGFTYDLTGNGTSVVKLNYARYVGQMGGNTVSLSDVLNPVAQTELDYPWVDRNGDFVVQANEIDATQLFWKTPGYDPDHPESLTTTGTVSRNLKASTTDEIIVGFDRQLSRDVAVGGSVIYRRYDNFAWFPRTGITSADYEQRTYTPTAAECTAATARCPQVTYWRPIKRLPSAFVTENRPDYYREYKGVELTMRKRMANRWMMNASYSYNDAPVTYASAAAYDDPTNVDMMNHAQYAEESTSSGLDNVFVNAKWIFRASGAYTLPLARINLAGFYNARSGYPFMQVIFIDSAYRNSAGSVNVLLDPIGKKRLPTFQQLDARLDRGFKLGPTSITASMDVFNLLNANTTLSIRRKQNVTNANTIANIVSPRVIRFGLRMTF